MGAFRKTILMTSLIMTGWLAAQKVQAESEGQTKMAISRYNQAYKKCMDEQLSRFESNNSQISMNLGLYISEQCEQAVKDRASKFYDGESSN